MMFENINKIYVFFQEKCHLLIKLSNKNRSIKSCLMDNKIVLGIGNIYALEGLFLARIHPLSLAKNLSSEQIALLIKCLKDVLFASIEAGGTTLRDFVNG
jgi:formamidopyrimidine-DNA glycosylase